eukprot:253200-Pleurochrysis_carterae.AAC.3
METASEAEWTDDQTLPSASVSLARSLRQCSGRSFTAGAAAGRNGKKDATAEGDAAPAGGTDPTRIEPTSFLSTKRAQHIQITLSRFRATRDPTLMHEALMRFDASVISAEDVPAILSCLPNEEEEGTLRALPKEALAHLAKAEDFLWRMAQLPRVRQRLSAFMTRLQLEPQVQRVRARGVATGRCCRGKVLPWGGVAAAEVR